MTVIIRQPYFDVADGSAGVIDKPSAKEPKADDDTELIDKLIGDKDLIDVDDEEDVKDEDEDKEPEVKLEEDKETEEDDDDLLEPDTNIRAVDFKRIKEKYGDFAKTNEFRELKNAYYRETKYTELFPSLEDAQEAAENNTTFTKLNDDIINHGDASSLLQAVKAASPESFKKLTTSFLETVGKLDGNLYVEAITPVIKKLARQINAEGMKILKRNDKSEDGQALVATARNIMQYAFEDAELVDKDEPQPDGRITEKERELQGRENAIRQEKFQSAYGVCANSVEKNLDKVILQGLDPDGKLNDFTRDTLLEKIKSEIKGQIDKDQLHLRRMSSLWKRAEQNGFNRDSLSSIVSAYLERARPIIPIVRSKLRSIAIKGKSPDKEDDRGPRIPNRGRTGRAAPNDGKVDIKQVNTKKIDYRNTSDDDIFEGKVKLRS